MKGKTVAILILVAILGAGILPVVSADGTTVSIGSATVEEGETAVVSIMIEDVENATGASIILNYNKDVVHVTDIGDTQFAMETHKMIDNTTGQAVYAAAQLMGSLSGDVRLANVTLKAVGAAGDSSYLDITVLSLVNSSYEEIPRDVVNGTFTISGGPEQPKIVSYTISPRTITPPETTSIDVKFSETVDYIIAIEKDTATIYDWTGQSENPNAKVWDGTYEVNGSVVPDGDYRVNVTGVNATNPDLRVNNNTQIITVTSELQYTLEISSTAGGTVTAPGEGPFTYPAGSLVALVAVPDSGYEFVNWTGDVSTIADVNANDTTITMNGNYAIKANFEPIIPYTLEISSTAGGSVTVPGEGTFIRAEDEEVNLKAVADSGYEFDKWTGDIDTIDNVSANETTITMNGNYTIQANFEPTPTPTRRYGGGAGRVRATPTPTPIATPTPAPTPTPTSEKPTPPPTIPPAATVTPGPTPTPTPTEPGFEAVFAIAGLLAVAYLVLRKKRK